MQDTLGNELGRFDLSVPMEDASTPPASWYVDGRFFERERQTVFQRTWQYACAADQVAEAGQFVRFDLMGESFVVLRGEDGELRALHNVCRHHGAQIVEGCGRTDQLTCPYHGWRYGLDGSLQSAPGMGRMGGFDRGAFGLPQVRVEVWGPLVFVHPGEPASSVADELRGVGELLEATNIEDLRWVSRRRYPMKCNWKVFADNYLDGGYHVGHLHGGLASQIDLDQYQTTVEERVSIQTCPSREAPTSYQGIDFSARIGAGAIYAFHYPNFMINRYGPILDTNWIQPVAPDRCEVVFDYWFPKTGSESTDEFIERSLDASDQVQQEDVMISESVQRGLGSSSYDQGRYAKTETAMHHFHRLLLADLSHQS